jgi:hypothetical protein
VLLATTAINTDSTMTKLKERRIHPPRQATLAASSG